MSDKITKDHKRIENQKLLISSVVILEEKNAT